MTGAAARHALAAAVLTLCLPPPAAAQRPAPRTSATAGSVAIGGNVSNSPITLKTGISPEEVRALVRTAGGDWRKLTDSLLRKLGEVQRELGVPIGALQTFFATLGEKDVPPENFPQKLGELAGQFLQLRQQIQPGAGDSPAIAGLKREARAALDAGKLDDADRALQRIEALLDGALESRLAERADTAAQRAGVAMTQLRYKDAATLFAQAARFTPDGDARRSYLGEEAWALYQQGYEFGDNAASFAAITDFQALLNEYSRERAPLGWAGAQRNLGVALRTLGERESGTARLEQAVGAYNAALGVYTRDRAPLQWAMTQNELGIALGDLGARESGTTRLELSLEAYRAALGIFTREREPLRWAMVQNNIGIALVSLAERERGTARLKQAVEAFRAVLGERTRERVPLDWALTQNALGTSLRTLGERENGTARFEQAVEAYRAALTECTRERRPLDWAVIQYNLAVSLKSIGKREGGTVRLGQAVTAYRAALSEHVRERLPLEWALNTLGLFDTQVRMADRTGDLRLLNEATAIEARDLLRAGGHAHWAAFGDHVLAFAAAVRARYRDERGKPAEARSP